MISIDFLIASLIVVLIPGTGVIYTINVGLYQGRKNMFFASFGCTLGIIPHMLVSILTIGLVFELNNNIYEILKILGISYLIYMSWQLWNNKSSISFNRKKNKKVKILINGFLLNILNPKLSIFLIAFIPQFVQKNSTTIILDVSILSFIFMLMTLLVFILYGMMASSLNIYMLNTNKKQVYLQRVFSLFFVLLACKLIYTN